MKLIVIAMLLTLPLAAQTNKKEANPPSISDALKVEFWKAQAQQLQTESAWQSARNRMQEVLKEVQAVCGNDFQPQINPLGDPVCAAKQAVKEYKSDGK